MPLYRIYWGSWWATSAGQTLQSQIEGSIMPVFYNSSMLDGLHQYGVSYREFNGSSPGHNNVANNYSDPPEGFSESALESVITYAINNRASPI